MNEISQELELLLNQINEMAGKLNLGQKREEIERLEAKTLEANFWSDDQQAKKVMQNLADLREEVELIDELINEIKEQLELIELADKDDEVEMKSEMQLKVKKITVKLKKLEVNLFLSGKHDKGSAILSIHAGQGGTEAMDWAEMLYRMYVRYIEKQGWKYEQIEESRGEEAGIKSVILMVKGRNAYGFLKNEYGTHRLVRQSPFNADNLRQTSFALVEVLPDLEDETEIEVKDEDLEWQFFRSGGHGGQNVNKVSTAVRLTHKPSGFVVESQTQRHQEQNRKNALAILKAKLWQAQEKEKEKKVESLKGQKMASWGTQIRNYVLHPYKLVKDLRTEVESSNPDAVLDGDLDEFIESEIKL